jgi:hypothetical protein
VDHNRNAKKFKNKGLRKLVEILEGKRATSEFARSRGKRIRNTSEEGGFEEAVDGDLPGNTLLLDSALEDDSDLLDASQLPSQSSLAAPVIIDPLATLARVEPLLVQVSKRLKHSVEVAVNGFPLC